MNRLGRIEIPGEIRLADEPELVVGRMIARPASLEILVGTQRATIEPRMMQLLVALARERGEVVSRDSLILSCWSGRFVSDDAVNRCVAKVRRLANGAGGFRIETINRVGYRLVETAPEDRECAHALTLPADAPPGVNRRLFLGTGVAAMLAGTTGLFLRGGRGDPIVPADVAPLMTQARIALNICTAESVGQALGLLSHVVVLRPDYAEGWADLALAYAFRANGYGNGDFEQARQLARVAAGRALELDPHSGHAKAALAVLNHRLGHWLVVEQGLRAALADVPRDTLVSQMLAIVMAEVGRNRDGAALLEAVPPTTDPSPSFLNLRIHALWSTGRVDEAGRVAEEARAIYPTHRGLWFVHFYMLLGTGRVDEAIRFAGNVPGRPLGIPADDFENILAVARAAASRRAADVDRAVARTQAAARRGIGYVENAISFLSVLGRVDAAFAAADDFYFGPQIARDAIRFSRQQGSYSRARDRDTDLLFSPLTQAMRADPRFARLTASIGLDAYWAQSGHQPDFLRT